MIFVIVLRQRIFVAVKCKCTLGNAVSVTSDDATEVRTFFFVIFQIVKAQYDVTKVTVTIRNPEFGHRAAIIGNFSNQSVGIGQRIKIDLLAIFGDSEIRL